MKNQERAQLQRLQQFSSYVALGHEQLRPRQLMLLATIAEEPGLSQTELADRIGVTPAAMSRNMDSMGSAGRRDREGPGLGWITSQDDPADDRPNRVYLTDEGQRILQTMLGMLWP